VQDLHASHVKVSMACSRNKAQQPDTHRAQGANVWYADVSSRLFASTYSESHDAELLNTLARPDRSLAAKRNSRHSIEDRERKPSFRARQDAENMLASKRCGMLRIQCIAVCLYDWHVSADPILEQGCGVRIEDGVDLAAHICANVSQAGLRPLELRKPIASAITQDEAARRTRRRTLTWLSELT
jgi:hypothetical protein